MGGKKHENHDDDAKTEPPSHMLTESLIVTHVVMNRKEDLITSIHKRAPTKSLSMADAAHTRL